MGLCLLEQADDVNAAIATNLLLMVEIFRIPSCFGSCFDLSWLPELLGRRPKKKTHVLGRTVSL